MNNLKEKIFIVSFLILIFSVSIIQAVYELNPKSSDENIIESTIKTEIQAWHLIKDIFTTPVDNIKQQDSIISILNQDLNFIAANYHKHDDEVISDSLNSIMADFSYKIKDLHKSYLVKNRHITVDSTELTLNLLKIDSLSKDFSLEGLNNSQDNQLKFLSRLKEIQTELKYFELQQDGVIKVIYDAIFHHVVFSQKYLRKYEAEMEDNSIVSQKTRPIIQYLRYQLYQDAGEKVLVGQDDWFFYKIGVDYLVRPWVEDPRSKVVDYNDKAVNENPIETILEFQKQLNEKGIELLVVVVPGKASIYPDKVNSNMKPQDAVELSHTPKVLAKLNSLGVKTVNLFDPMKNNRLEAIVDGVEADPLYLKSDTHWRLSGLKVASTQVAQAIKSYDWYDDSTAYKQTYLIKPDTVDREGDVGVMSQLKSIEFYDASTILPLEKTPAEKVFLVKKIDKLDTIYNAQTKEIDSIISSSEVKATRPYKDDYRRSRILILGDSFSRIYQTDAPHSAGWISHLAYELSEPLASVVSDGGASTLVRQTLARKAKVLKNKKLVVWEFVERDFRYGAEGWKKVALP